MCSNVCIIVPMHSITEENSEICVFRFSGFFPRWMCVCVLCLQWHGFSIEAHVTCVIFRMMTVNVCACVCVFKTENVNGKSIRDNPKENLPPSIFPMFNTLIRSQMEWDEWVKKKPSTKQIENENIPLNEPKILSSAFQYVRVCLCFVNAQWIEQFFFGECVLCVIHTFAIHIAAIVSNVVLLCNARKIDFHDGFSCVTALFHQTNAIAYGFGMYYHFWGGEIYMP